MPEPSETQFFNRIQDLYRSLNLPTDHIDSRSEFDIHNLNTIHSELPFNSPVFRANYFSFVFVEDGVGAYTTGEKHFAIQPRTVYFTNPGHYKSFAWQRIKSVYLLSISETFFKQNVYADIFAEFPFLLAETVPPKVMSPDVFDEFNGLCQQLLGEYTTDSPYRNRIIGSLFAVILLKIKAYFWQDYDPIYEGNRSSQIVKEFKKCLEQHFRSLSQPNVQSPKLLRVQDCANTQYLHPNYLSTVIKSKTGKSVSAWITEKTITEAKAMLQNSSLSIKEIAYRLGFAESTHFSAYFKKHAGLSPVLYRKQH